MDGAPWTGTPWFGRLVIRGPRGRAVVDERLAALDGTRVDGTRIRVKHRRGRVRAWQVGRGRRELSGPVVSGRLVERGGSIELEARVRPTLPVLALGTYGIGLVVRLLAAAIAGRDAAALLGAVAAAAFVSLVVGVNRRAWREGLAATEQVLGRALAGHVVERRPWRPHRGKGTSTSG